MLGSSKRMMGSTKSHRASDSAGDGLQTGRESAEKLAPSRWSQPVAKTHSQCDIQMKGSRSSPSRPPTASPRSPPPPGRHQNLAIAPSPAFVVIRQMSMVLVLSQPIHLKRRPERGSFVRVSYSGSITRLRRERAWTPPRSARPFNQEAAKNA